MLPARNRRFEDERSVAHDLSPHAVCAHVESFLSSLQYARTGLLTIERLDRPSLIVATPLLPVPADVQFRWEISSSNLTQRVVVQAHSWWAQAWWYALLPLHLLVFSSLLKGIVRGL